MRTSADDGGLKKADPLEIVKVSPADLQAAKIVTAGTEESAKREEDFFKLGKQQNELDRERIELERERLELDRLKTEIASREKYARQIFLLVCTWLTLVLVVVVCVGLGKLSLHDNVLITLIGSTTVNVLALFAIVAKYLFHHDKAIPKKNGKKGSKGKRNNPNPDAPL